LADARGALRLRASAGFARSAGGMLPTFWGQLNFLRNVMARGEAMAFRAPGPSDRVNEILKRAGADSLVLAPLMNDDQRLGILAVAGPSRELPNDWQALVDAAARPVAQAVVLAQAVGRLYHTEARFRAVADTDKDGLVIADADGNIVYINAVAERVL